MMTHTFSAARLCQLLLPQMRERGRGHVVMISSSEVAHMRANGAPYNMAKAALEALALTMAKEEIGNGIRVNIAAPGLVVTDMGAKLVRAKLGVDDMTELDASQPLGRVARPADVARVVRFLVSEERGLRHRPADRRRRWRRRVAHRRRRGHGTRRSVSRPGEPARRRPVRRLHRHALGRRRRPSG